MATSMGSGPTAATAPRLLPHQLVPRDGRSSYIKRIDTLAGPGAYAIPSTFTTTPVNAMLRVVHQEQFGRDFARQQRLSQAPQPPTPDDERVETEEGDAEAVLTKQERHDRYLARRERLRELLQAVGYPDRHCEEPSSIASPDSTTLSKSSAGSLPLSPSLSCTSNYDVFVAGYRQQQHQQQQRDRVKSHSSTRSLRSPTSPTSMSTCDFESISFATDSPRNALSPKANHEHAPAMTMTMTMTPRSYREYLATTSYSKRLHRASLRQQPQPQPQQHNIGTSSHPSASNFKPASSPDTRRQRSC